MPLLRAVPWLRRLVACLSSLRPGFATGPINVGFVVDKVTMGQVLLLVLWFLPARISFLHQLYVDYKQAYDSIKRAQLVEIIKEFGITKTLMRLVK
jgi:hypothetical protein